MILFLIVIAISSSLAIIGREAEQYKYLLYVFKPLTMLLIITLGFYLNDNYENLYFVLIITGLIFGLVGDIFLMFPDEHFTKGLFSFLAAHLFYIGAFYSALNEINLILLISIVTTGLFSINLLLKVDAKKKIYLMLYGFVILIMISFALELHLEEANYLLLIGAILFLISDLILAINKFVNQLNNAHVFILSTYFAAQTFIVLSI